MKKKAIIFFLSLLIVLSVWKSEAVAIVSDEPNITLIETDSSGASVVSEEQKNKIVQELKDNYNYEGEELILGDSGEATLKLKTSIKIIEKVPYQTGNRYKIQIGNGKIIGTNVNTDYVTEKDLINKYGFVGREEDKVAGYSWDVVLIGGIRIVNKQSNQYVAEVYVSKLYSGDDYKTGEAYQIKETGYELHGASSMSSAFNDSNSSKESVGEIILNLLADYVNIPIGDIIHSLLDKSGADLTEQEADKILYDRTELENPANKFYNEIKVSNYKEDIDSNTLIDLPIRSTTANKNGKNVNVFESSTKIPVIPVNLYSMLTTDMDLFDIDLLSSNNNNRNKTWKFYRNLVSSISHAVLYVCAALLIGMIIARAILLVISTYNVKAVEKSKKIMDDFVQAIIYIVGAYLIVAVMNNFYKVMISFITNNATRFPLRANVENIYSFNTNAIGGIRYMTQSPNIGTKYGYSFLYLIAAIVNFICFLGMFIRTFLLGIVVMMAPIPAITKTLGEGAKESIFQFKGWLKFYSIVLWIPSFAIIIISLILRLSGKE